MRVIALGGFDSCLFRPLLSRRAHKHRYDGKNDGGLSDHRAKHPFDERAFGFFNFRHGFESQGFHAGLCFLPQGFNLGLCFLPQGFHARFDPCDVRFRCKVGVEKGDLLLGESFRLPFIETALFGEVRKHHVVAAAEVCLEPVVDARDEQLIADNLRTARVVDVVARARFEHLL